MPVKGDSFIITLKETHLGWGTHRSTSSRPIINNEGYIPIPSKYAVRFNITNIITRINQIFIDLILMMVFI